MDGLNVLVTGCVENSYLSVTKWLAWNILFWVVVWQFELDKESTDWPTGWLLVGQGMMLRQNYWLYLLGCHVWMIGILGWAAGNLLTD